MLLPVGAARPSRDAFAEDLLCIVHPIVSADEALPLPSEQTN